MEDLLNPIGITGNNPYKETPCLEVEFEWFGGAVRFPGVEGLEDHGRRILQPDTAGGTLGSKASGGRWTRDCELPDSDREQIKSICNRDPLSDITEQEKDLLWRYRERPPVEIPIKSICNRDPLSDITAQEKDLLWRYR
ncbi:phosphatidylinositol 4,5-bisphosphate 3-kinase catalytic subunit alpha isoform-like [Lampetra fluviatilis]